MNNPPKITTPTPESYWVIPGSFLAGRYPASTQGDEEHARQNLGRFLEAGVTCFFDLTQPQELRSYQALLEQEASRFDLSVRYQRFPIQDYGLPSISLMMNLLNAVDASLARGSRIYLHCWGGVGRTGTAVGCWLVRHGRTGEQAIQYLNQLFRTTSQGRLYPRSPEVDEQVQFILDWKEDGLA